MISVFKAALISLIATLIRDQLPDARAEQAATKMIERLVDQSAGVAALLASRRGDSLAMPTRPDAERIHIPPARLPADAIEIKLPDLSRVALEPGDTLLLRCVGQLSEAQVRLIQLRLTQAFPGNKIVMISSQVELSVVRPLSHGDAPH